MSAWKQSLGLALGGGGARGISHIGVLKALERECIAPQIITGTSIGALIAAAYAADPDAAGLERRLTQMLMPESVGDNLLKLLNRVNWSDNLTDGTLNRFYRLLQKELFWRISMYRTGILKNEDLRTWVESFVPDIHLEQTRIPVALVATDLMSGQQVILTKGPIIPAVMASCAVPGFMSPVSLNGRILIDGGAVNLLPADVARRMGAHCVVGVNASVALDQPCHFEDAIDVINRATQIMTMHLGRDGLAHSDIIIDPNNGSFDWIRFQDYAELIRRGEHATDAKIDQIRALLSADGGSKRNGGRRLFLKSNTSQRSGFFRKKRRRPGRFPIDVIRFLARSHAFKLNRPAKSRRALRA